MRNAYLQVLLVYFRKPFTSFTQGIFIGSGLFSLSMLFVMRGPHFASALLQVMEGMLFLNLSIWLIFYEQAVGIRLRLWPHFVRRQLAIFLLIATSVLAFETLAFGRCADAALMSVIAFNIGFFALLGVILALHSGMTALLATAVAFSMPFTPAMARINKFFAGEFPGTAWAIVIGSVVAVALTLRRFSIMDEENSAYRISTTLDSTGAKPRMTGEGNQAWAQISETGFQAQFREFFRPSINFGNSQWDRIRRWQYQGIWQLAPFLMSAVCLRILIAWCFTRTIGPLARPFPDFTLVFLVTITAVQWQQRWRYIESEFLRPVTRQNFFTELGLAMTLNFAIVLVGGLLAISLPALMWSRSDSHVLPLFLNALMQVAVVIFVFGFCAGMLRHRSRGAFYVLLLALPASLTSVAGTSIDVPRASTLLPWIIVGSCVIALIGIALAVRVYRLWLTTELG